MATLPTGTVTYLMTDIVGSARLWEADQQAMAEAMRAHDRIGQQVADRHCGHLVKARGEGDSLFLVFEEPTDAVQAAVDFLAKLNCDAATSKVHLQVRAAIHTGASETRDADYYGPAVNRCARLRSIANPGQILVSRATRQLLETAPPGVTFHDLGTHRLKDLLRPESIAEVVHSELPATSSVLGSLNRVHHNLPVQLTSFIGREHEVRDVIKKLTEHREITLLGSGGCGKTRLSLQVGAEVADQYPAGVWFIDLTRLASEGSCADFVVDTMHLVRGHGNSAETTIAEAFSGEPALLIFDNCEHVVDGAATLIDFLLAHTQRTTILATSREALRIASEFRFRVPSLSVPAPGADFDTIAATDSVRLFVERATSRAPVFELNHRNAPAVGELCSLLDGIPLSIEQAASHASIFTPQQMLRRFKDRLSLLEMNERGVVPRHRTMRATIEWSYGMLTFEERLLLERCSTFIGTWTVDMAELICSDEELPFGSIAIALESLLAKSLVIQVEGHSDQVRFRMLQTIREYGLEKLGQNAGRIRKAHAKYFLDISREWETAGDWTSVAEDHDELVRAIEWLIEREPAAALDLVLNIRRYFFASGHLRQARTWINATLGHAESESKKATAYNLLGSVLFSLGERADARVAFDQSLFLWKLVGDKSQEAAVLHNQGLLAAADTDYETARRLLLSASALYDEMNDRRGFAMALRNLARTQLELGELSDCQNSATSAENIFRGIGDLEMALSAAAVASTALYVSGDEPRSLATLSTCFTGWSEHVDHASCILAMAVLSKIALSSGEQNAAKRIALMANLLNEEVGLKLRELESSLFKEVLAATSMRSVPIGTSDYETCVSESKRLCEALTKVVK